jgi:cyclase
MDAKRIVPVLQVDAGQIVVPEATAGEPAAWACRLELEGADGVLFREVGPADAERTHWIRQVAGSLSVPFALEAPFLDLTQVEQALEAGVDKVVLGPAAAGGRLLQAAVQAFGRTHVAVTGQAVLVDGRWRVELEDQPQGRDALAWMVELEQRGAGEILLRTAPETEAIGGLFQGAAGLALSVLFLVSGDEAMAAEALLHGADGVAFPALVRTARQWKAALAARGLSVRD